MNWDDLKLFLAVARYGTMSSAAKHLNIQHSTISRRVRALEKQLGVSLLVRKKGTYKLTEAGTTIEQAATRMESEVIGVDGALLGQDSRLVGPLRITTISIMSSTVLMPMFNSFCKTYPEIELHIVASNTVASLSQREADVAIRSTNMPGETLIGKRLVTIKSTIYGSPDYLKQHRQNDEELKLIGAECCDFHRSWTNQSSDASTFQFNCDDALITVSALKEGLGVSFLPCFMGDADPLLERYCDPDPKFDLGLWVLIHPEQKHNARVLAFRNHIIQSINAQKALFEGCT
jgi:DNA-binding transcriptional LysR family regulator